MRSGSSARAAQPAPVSARTSAVEDSSDGTIASTGRRLARYSNNLPGTVASAPTVVLAMSSKRLAPRMAARLAA
jgi:hypothetical protein